MIFCPENPCFRHTESFYFGETPMKTRCFSVQFNNLVVLWRVRPARAVVPRACIIVDLVPKCVVSRNPCTRDPCTRDPCTRDPCPVYKRPVSRVPCARDPCPVSRVLETRVPCARDPCARDPCARDPCARDPCARDTCPRVERPEFRRRLYPESCRVGRGCASPVGACAPTAHMGQSALRTLDPPVRTQGTAAVGTQGAAGRAPVESWPQARVGGHRRHVRRPAPASFGSRGGLPGPLYP